MAGSDYRFGPFVVDRTRYRVLRGDVVLDLTPKLLDLLLHLVDNAGALTTKEQLLDALWPGANVTDNALAQAVSELRVALGDEAATPRFIKTVARRGYRFIAPVERIDPPGGEPATPPPAAARDALQSIAVMDCVNVTGDADSAWLSAGIAETVTGDLRAIGRFRVVDRGRVIDAIRGTGGSVAEVSARLGTAFAVVGSYQRSADRIRITAHRGQPRVAAVGVLHQLRRLVLPLRPEVVLPDVGWLEDVAVGVDDPQIRHGLHLSSRVRRA